MLLLLLLLLLMLTRTLSISKRAGLRSGLGAHCRCDDFEVQSDLLQEWKGPQEGEFLDRT
jgi:hypothetical protein